MTYRAVIFDFFGTLTEAIQRGAAHARIAMALGCEPAAFTAMLNETFPARSRGELGAMPLALREVARRLGITATEEQIQRAVAARLEAVGSDIRLRADAVPTLTALREAGFRLAVVSDCTDELPRLLPTLPVGPLLDAAVYSFELKCSKPDPEMYLSAARLLRVEPNECLYVGDGSSRELSGAKAVGMTAVRLDAPDLVNHLKFDAETDWQGASVPSLSAVLALILGA